MFFLRIGMHLANGSPVYRTGHVQIGLWFTTWHSALSPHTPGQGSIHFWLTQAWLSEHSVLVTHSGLQAGGLPRKPGTQEQTAWPLISRHWLLAPHGDGVQGFLGTWTAIRFLSWDISVISSTSWRQHWFHNVMGCFRITGTRSYWGGSHFLLTLLWSYLLNHSVYLVHTWYLYFTIFTLKETSYSN